MISQIINYLPVIVALLVFIIAYKFFARCMRKADKVVEKFEEDGDDDDEEENKSDEELFKELKGDIANAKNKLIQKTMVLNDRIEREFTKMMDKYDSIDKASKREEVSDRRNVTNEQRTNERSTSEEKEERTDRRDDDTDSPEKEDAIEASMGNNNDDMDMDQERRSSRRRSSRRQPVDRDESDNEDNIMRNDGDEVVESFVEGVSSCTTANCYTYA